MGGRTAFISSLEWEDSSACFSIIAISKKEFRNRTNAGEGENRIHRIVSSSCPGTIAREMSQMPSWRLHRMKSPEWIRILLSKSR